MQEFKLPDLGEGMQEAEVVEWLVKAGDTLKLDQTMLKVETDKASRRNTFSCCRARGGNSRPGWAGS